MPPPRKSVYAGKPRVKSVYAGTPRVKSGATTRPVGELKSKGFKPVRLNTSALKRPSPKQVVFRGKGVKGLGAKVKKALASAKSSKSAPRRLTSGAQVKSSGPAKMDTTALRKAGIAPKSATPSKRPNSSSKLFPKAKPKQRRQSILQRAMGSVRRFFNRGRGRKK